MEIKYRTIFEKNPQTKYVCNTCHTEIEGIARLLILRDKDEGPHVIFSHYFFPCWDLGLLCQQYPNLCIDKLGFCIPDDSTITPETRKTMQKEIKFWI